MNVIIPCQGDICFCPSVYVSIHICVLRYFSYWNQVHMSNIIRIHTCMLVFQPCANTAFIFALDEGIRSALRFCLCREGMRCSKPKPGWRRHRENASLAEILYVRSHGLLKLRCPNKSSVPWTWSSRSTEFPKGTLHFPGGR